MHLLYTFFMYVTLSASWNIILHVGLTSLMQQLFIAIGAYAAIFLLFVQVPFVVCIPLAGAAAAMIALATGIPLIRLRGAPFSVGTIAVSNFMMYLFINTEALGGSLGIQLPLPPYPDKVPFYYMSMLIGVVAAYAFHTLKPSKFGIAIVSIRENEMAAESLGLNPAKYKLLALIIGAGFTGMAGPGHFLSPVHGLRC